VVIQIISEEGSILDCCTVTRINVSSGDDTQKTGRRLMSDTVHGEHEHAADIDEQVRIYVIVFAALAGLTLLTVAVGYLHLPMLPAVAVGVFIATVKGGLVAGYFMHLISEERVIYLVLAFTVVFFLGMLVLTMSTLYDQVGGPGVP
jgi:cytochrome c oxidase subunit 4